MLPHYAQLTFPHPRPCVTNPAGAGSPHSHQIHIPPHFYFPPPASLFHAAQLWPGSSQHLLGMSAVLLPSAFEGLHVARSALDASLGSLPPRLGLRAASHGNAVHGGRGHVARVAEAVTKGASCRILACFKHQTYVLPPPLLARRASTVSSTQKAKICSILPAYAPVQGHMLQPSPCTPRSHAPPSPTPDPRHA